MIILKYFIGQVENEFYLELVFFSVTLQDNQNSCICRTRVFHTLMWSSAVRRWAEFFDTEGERLQLFIGIESNHVDELQGDFPSIYFFWLVIMYDPRYSISHSCACTSLSRAHFVSFSTFVVTPLFSIFNGYYTMKRNKRQTRHISFSFSFVSHSRSLIIHDQEFT